MLAPSTLITMLFDSTHVDAPEPDDIVRLTVGTFSTVILDFKDGERAHQSEAGSQEVGGELVLDPLDRIEYVRRELRNGPARVYGSLEIPEELDVCDREPGLAKLKAVQFEKPRAPAKLHRGTWRTRPDLVLVLGPLLRKDTPADWPAGGHALPESLPTLILERRELRRVGLAAQERDFHVVPAKLTPEAVAWFVAQTAVVTPMRRIRL